jgi:hypothetical protein
MSLGKLKPRLILALAIFALTADGEFPRDKILLFDPLCRLLSPTVLFFFATSVMVNYLLDGHLTNEIEAGLGCIFGRRRPVLVL